MHVNHRVLLGLSVSSLIQFVGLLVPFLALFSLPSIAYIFICIGGLLTIVSVFIREIERRKTNRCSAKKAVLVYLSVIFCYFFIAFRITTWPERSVISYVKNFNTGGPYTSLNSSGGVRYTQAQLAGNRIQFAITVIDGYIFDYDADYLNNEFYRETLNGICEKYRKKRFLQNGYSIEYRYYDEGENLIVDVYVDATKCRHVIGF